MNYFETTTSFRSIEINRVLFKKFSIIEKNEVLVFLFGHAKNAVVPNSNRGTVFGLTLTLSIF